MSENSKIQWTDATWNPVSGCSKVSPGCAKCYAEIMAKRLKAMALADIKAGREPGRKKHYIDVIDDNGRWNGKLVCVYEALEIPLKWKKPRRIFVNSMSDLFHENVPFEFIDEVFAVMAFCPQHQFQVLTKRADRMAEYMTTWPNPAEVSSRCEAVEVTIHSTILGDDPWCPTPSLRWPLPNVWLGVSAENQEQWDKRVDFLTLTPAAKRFISAEPLLGPIEVHHAWRNAALPNQVIIGGESGPGARPCNVAWIRSLIGQCQEAGVACFVKQLGSNHWAPHGRFDRPISLKDPKGGDMSEWPKELRVRESV